MTLDDELLESPKPCGFEVVPGAGIEPARCFHRGILSPSVNRSTPANTELTDILQRINTQNTQNNECKKPRTRPQPKYRLRLKIGGEFIVIAVLLLFLAVFLCGTETVENINGEKLVYWRGYK